VANRAELLYDAVVGLRLTLFAWPTLTAKWRTRQPEEALDTLEPIPVALIKRIRPLHGGLPSTFIGGRQPILKPFPRISESDVAVFLGTEFERWLEGERSKGGWVTQRPSNIGDNRARVPRGPGRPSILREVERTIAAIVADGDWTKAEPVSRLGGFVRARGIKVNDDTVRKALDGLYIQTGDSRYCSRFFERRNPWAFQR
jgi:hypothetical protein